MKRPVQPSLWRVLREDWPWLLLLPVLAMMLIGVMVL